MRYQFLVKITNNCTQPSICGKKTSAQVKQSALALQCLIPFTMDQGTYNIVHIRPLYTLLPRKEFPKYVLFYDESLRGFIGVALKTGQQALRLSRSTICLVAQRYDEWPSITSVTSTCGPSELIHYINVPRKEHRVSLMIFYQILTFSIPGTSTG